MPEQQGPPMPPGMPPVMPIEPQITHVIVHAVAMCSCMKAILAIPIGADLQCPACQNKWRITSLVHTFDPPSMQCKVEKVGVIIPGLGHAIPFPRKM